jgi:formylmethanofuran dehydrogenase subunit C
MDRGLIRVQGDAGERTGERMRRGLILIQGNAGGWCGADMIAGTVAVQGEVGPMAGSGMRRGTLFLAREPKGLPVTFNDNGIQELAYIGLLLHELARVAEEGGWSTLRKRPVRRLLGDVGDGGIGEILWPAGTG